MIYITGDTHGDISCFKNPKLNKLGEKDILIVCGDFGFIWNPHDKNERKNELFVINLWLFKTNRLHLSH